ncbi:FkbM family methyltransferase [uncultured Sphingomonas sp.]|uniref:FkbM family methyltransferase n=1 Tax=uncultured Sphingomonas sp. TaxID=158754 RepID=UPI00374A499F
MGRRIRTLTRHLPSQNLVGTIYRTPNGVFSIAASDIALANVLRRNLAWSDHEVEAINAVTDPASRVLFVGAHVGTLVVPVARHVAHVTAIEANPDTYRFLAANLALNSIVNVTLHGYAAGEADGEIEFMLSRLNSGGAKRRPIIADGRYTYDNPSIVRVPMQRLDNALEGTFDTIVMDIEGSEVFALRGMPRLLAGAQRLFVEFLPHHLRNVAGVDSDAFCDLILPHLPRLTIDGQVFDADDARVELRRMFVADEANDLICFSR